jgi:DNA polymerase III epsilon subunit-like protein
MTDWTSLTYVVIDVEGNGQQPPDLVELAAVRIEGGVIGEPVSWLVRPLAPITPMAMRIHGITNEQVATAPAFVDVQADVLKVLDASALVAHNAHVGVGVLQRKLGEWECPEVFDTLKLARRLLPGNDGYKLWCAGRGVPASRRTTGRLGAAPGDLRRAGDGPAVRAPGHAAGHPPTQPGRTPRRLTGRGRA